jgi:hypothetical protein
MKITDKQSKFIGLPSWALAILAAILVMIIMGIFNWQVKAIGNHPRYMIWGGLTAISCFFISWNDPRSFWYVPLLCNVLVLLPAIFDDSFWTTPFWIIMLSGLGLSFITAFLGAKVGQRTAGKDT